jgi:hypothetical protein
MTLALIRTNLKKPNHQVYNSSQQQQEYKETETAKSINTKKKKVKIGTHLTIIGVCTTICPENSGT